MSRLFISHSSWNNDKAIEVRAWLANNGWDDVFLDLDPERGIAAGQRWKEALQKAAYRCEVVLALVSKEWLASSWCKSEVDAARMMGKKVIAARVEIDKSQVPPDLTDEQFIDLTGDPDAYRRLKEGLKRAGLDPTSFPFEPGRRPYPGFAYLEEKDAAVFFGRDAQIVRGLDEIRTLTRTGVTRMFVILGASGSGKSSFLRAGLWPRLKRDDLAWLPIPIVRPERAAISGKYGLAQGLFEIMSEPRFADGIRQRGLPRSRADIHDFIDKTDDGLAALLAALRDIALAGWPSDDNAAPLTTLIAVDQGEELFNEEGRGEAKRFIEILTKTLTADPRTLALLVMRSDSFPLVQSEASLAALPKDTFTLDMMLEGSYRAVIEGPARLVEPPLRIDPLLTDALLEDISGQDALPLLAFTLAHLYDNYRADKELILAGYQKIGRVKGVIEKTVAQAFAEAAARGEAPKDGKEQLALARSAFIPHLAQINAAGQSTRLVVPRDKIPAEARPLIDRFAEQRLLIKDRRQDVEVIEVAHEALLRQPPFSDWLAEDREFLVWRERLSQARAAFAANQRGLLVGRELSIARDYMRTRAEREIEPADLTFIRDSIAADDRQRGEEAEAQRKREAAEREEQERRIKDAERFAEEQKKAASAQGRTTQVAVVGLVIALLVAAAAVWQYFAAEKQKAAALNNETHALTALSRAAAREGRPLDGVELALAAWPRRAGVSERPMLGDAIQYLSLSFSEHPPAAVLNHEGTVWGALYSPDGRRILSWSEDDTLRLWDAATGAAIGEPLRHEGIVRGALYSPDGRRILSWSEDKTLRLWEAATGAAIGEPLRHEGSVNGALYSPDGRRILSWSADNTLRLWDAATGAAIGEPLRHENIVWGALYSPDGRRILSWSWDKTLRLWEAATGAAIGEPLRHENIVWGALYSPDGRRILSWSDDKTLRLWEAATGAAIGEPLRHENRINGALYSPDGRRILSWSEDKTLRLWDAVTGAAIGEPLRHEGSVNGALYSPDERRILSWSEDKTLRLWDAATGAAIGEPLRHEGTVWGALYSPDGRRILSWSEDKTLRLWDAATGAANGEPLRHEGTVWGALYSPDGRRILSWSEDKTLRLWDAATGAAIGEPLWHEGIVRGALYSPDGRRILSWSEDETLRLWDAATGAAIGEPLQHEGTVWGALYSPDGRRILSWSDGNTLRLWDAATGAAIGEPLRHENIVEGALYSPDGRRILSWSWDNTLRLWEAATGAAIGEPLRHEGTVWGALYSPDGRRILSWAQDNTLRLWDAATGAAIGEPLRHEGRINGALYSPNGQRILSWSKDKTLRLWDVSWRGDDLFEIACKYTPMMSSKEEMDRLTKRYGVKIDEPICQSGVKSPDPDWSHVERAHTK